MPLLVSFVGCLRVGENAVEFARNARQRSVVGTGEVSYCLLLHLVKFIAQKVFYLAVLLGRVFNVGENAPDGARNRRGEVLRPRHALAPYFVAEIADTTAENAF
jgi:hypothetical protein